MHLSRAGGRQLPRTCSGGRGRCDAGEGGARGTTSPEALRAPTSPASALGDFYISKYRVKSVRCRHPLEARPNRTPGATWQLERISDRHLHISDVRKPALRPRHYLYACPSASAGRGEWYSIYSSAMRVPQAGVAPRRLCSHAHRRIGRAETLVAAPLDNLEEEPVVERIGVRVQELAVLVTVVQQVQPRQLVEPRILQPVARGRDRRSSSPELAAPGAPSAVQRRTAATRLSVASAMWCTPAPA